MEVVGLLDRRPLQEIPQTARMAEEAECDVLLSFESRYDGLLPLVLAAEHTQRAHVGTGVAIALPRSPMVLAQAAWDLQRYSGGRFQLGLGTQVKGHNERRFSVPWSAPGPRLREYIQSLRAIWDSFQNGSKLDFRGKHYSFTLMTPFFNPGPIEHPHIPIFIAGINVEKCRLAGELCDGILLHPVCTPRYFQEVMWPAIQEGAQRSGRSLEGFQVSATTYAVTGKDEEEMERWRAYYRERMAFYFSTRTYRRALEVHGLSHLTPVLHEMSLKGQWQAMADLITDDILETFVAVAPRDRVGREIHRRWQGLASRVAISTLILDSASPDERQHLVRQLKGE